MIADLVKICRSYRRFYEDVPVSRADLLEMVDNARLSASARNAQSLKYYLSNTPETNDIIFPLLAWAGYLKDWHGPDQGERPSAYIIMLNDTNISNNYFCDHGIAAQSILLTACEKGYGGVIIASVSREKMKDELAIPTHLDVVQVIALGKPMETVVIDTVPPNGDIKYWRDQNNVHHVPKRSLNEIVIK